MSENVCSLSLSRPAPWLGEVLLVSLSLWTVSLLHCDPGCCLGRGLGAAWPSASLMVVGLWCLDSCRPVTSLLKLNYLIRTCHGIEHSEWNKIFFCIQFSLHFRQRCIYYIVPYFSIQYFFHFGFSISGILIYPCVGFSSLWFLCHFPLCAL